MQVHQIIFGLLVVAVPQLLAARERFFHRSDTPCAPRRTDYDSVVCVCNSTYCDTTRTTRPYANKVIVYSSSRDGLRFKRSTARLSQRGQSGSGPKFSVDTSERYQRVVGFGVAATDSTGVNMASLPTAAQEKFIRSYFGPDGADLNLIRIPAAGTDFSTRKYSYDDYADDVDLNHFNLTYEDTAYKIPIVNAAKAVSKREILLVGCPWSAPDWMKIQNGTNAPPLSTTTNGTDGLSYLNPKYYQVYANYLVRFLEEYKKYGHEFWALSTQNEPTVGVKFLASWNSMGWTAEAQRDFVVKNMGPTLESSGFQDVPILIFDDARDELVGWTKTVLSDPKAMQYVDVIGVHWYRDQTTPPELLDQTHDAFPNKMILYTENSFIVREPNEAEVKLGSWERADNYSASMIQVMNRHVVGWMDWNMAVNQEGGPNWANNRVDAPIVVNGDTGEFYKQPMFYVLAHLSKFVDPGSWRVKLVTSNADNTESVAFRTPKGEEVILILNRNESPLDATVQACGKGSTRVKLSPSPSTPFSARPVFGGMSFWHSWRTTPTTTTTTTTTMIMMMVIIMMMMVMMMIKTMVMKMTINTTVKAITISFKFPSSSLFLNKNLYI